MTIPDPGLDVPTFLGQVLTLLAGIVGTLVGITWAFWTVEKLLGWALRAVRES